jgi:glutathione S-transferase
MLELYQSHGSACCRKVHLVLLEKALPFTDHVFDLRRGDQLAPKYRRLNPRAEVPTLVHDGAPVIESTVIMEYLDEVFPEPPRTPADPLAKARMRLWTKWPDEVGHIAYSSLAFAVSHRHIPHDNTPGAVEAQLAEKPDEARQERQRQAIELGLDDPAIPATLRRFDRLLAEMEVSLADGPWLAGDALTLADLAIIPYVSRLSDMRLTGMWEASRPRIAEWFARVEARDSYRKVIVEKADPRVKKLMAENGAKAWPKLKEMLA